MLRSLKGVHLAFTGILSKHRREAVPIAKRAGAIVHGGPSARTTVVRPRTLLGETQFWRLADPRARTS